MPDNTAILAGLLSGYEPHAPLRCDHCDLPLMLAPVRAYRVNEGRRHMARLLLCWMGREEIAHQRREA